jgi:uncharacterized protein (TIGR02145 family)
MKQKIVIFGATVILMCYSIQLAAQQSVGVGTATPAASAVLHVQSTSKGILPPRMNQAQRDAITTPAEGLIISCTDCAVQGLHQYINGAWQAVVSTNTDNTSNIGNYGTVVNPVTGKVWLDRNLGASRVATSPTDVSSYGDLYQWGRNADGHQVRTSTTNTTLATSFFTTNGLFVIAGTSPFNWLSNVETHMWSGTAAENNPCPSGFRIPTAAEWEQERRTWSSNIEAGAFASPLKLPSAGFRAGNNGSLGFVGTSGYYWTSTVSGISSRFLRFVSNSAFVTATSRTDAFSVRCIQD